MKSLAQQLSEALADQFKFKIEIVGLAAEERVRNLPGFIPAEQYGPRTKPMNDREFGACRNVRYMRDHGKVT